jgi:serine/threonine protein phosphatase PrpC
MPYLIVTTSLLVSLFILRGMMGNVSGISKLDLGFAQTTGKRQLNADEYDWACHGDETLLALADGIGPGKKGKTAARTAIHIVTRVFEMTGTGQNPAYFFKQAFKGANSTILRYIPDSTAGSSLLCAVIKDGLLYYALAGNCRLSVYRHGELHSVSEGQTMDVLALAAFREKKISRAEALEAVKTSRLYNFVGKDGFRDLEIFDEPVRLRRGDLIVMTSDGVHDFCSADRIEGVLAGRGKCGDLARQVIDMVEREEIPDQDNASVILAKVNAL